MNFPLTLDNVVSKRRCVEPHGWEDWSGELNEAQRYSLVAIFGDHCRRETKARLLACVQDNCRRVKPCGILRRVQLSETGANYCAGQSYPDEVRVVRQVLIASY